MVTKVSLSQIQTNFATRKKFSSKERKREGIGNADKFKNLYA